MIRDRLPAPPPALIAVLASFGMVFGVTTAIGSDDTSVDPQAFEEKAGQYPATPRIAVASGTLEGIGAYKVLISRDYKGGLCTGLLLETGSPTGGPDISEGCGGPEEMNIGKVTAGDGSWTILNGKVPEGTAKVKVHRENGTEIELPAVADGKGVSGKFVVKKLAGTVGDVEFEAVDAEGRTLKEQRLGR